MIPGTGAAKPPRVSLCPRRRIAKKRIMDPPKLGVGGRRCWLKFSPTDSFIAGFYDQSPEIRPVLFGSEYDQYFGRNKLGT